MITGLWQCGSVAVRGTEGRRQAGLWRLEGKGEEGQMEAQMEGQWKGHRSGQRQAGLWQLEGLPHGAVFAAGATQAMGLD